jgi:hypothetical protein
MTKNRIRRSLLLLGQSLLVATLVAIFSALALWQWERAERHQELKLELVRIAALEPVSLTSIHRPQIALDGEITNRMVTLSGRYIDDFIARGQRAGDYHVALMEVRGSVPRAAILVAREIVGQQRGAVEGLGELRLLARLLPAQREDRDPRARASGDEEALVRIDSALLVERIADPTLALYDGYLLLHREIPLNKERPGLEVDLALIPDSIAEPTIPGYYWQHISYVVIWFLMAALTLFLPFYQWRRNRLLQ